MWKKMEVSEAECFTMVLLLYPGKRVNEGALQNFGQSWGTEFTQVCDASWERTHIRMVLHKGQCWQFNTACLLSVARVLCLPCPGFIGPNSEPAEPVKVCGTYFQEFQTLESHLGTLQGLHFFLMDKFQLWSWQWSAFCILFS